MKIKNVKLGYATNSSSTHSIIIVSDNKLDSIHEDVSSSSFGYGWENFVLKSKQEKLNYIAIILKLQLQGLLRNDILTDVVVNEWLPDADNGVYNVDSYVDHQSVFTFPYAYGTKDISKEFFNDFVSFILSDNVLILGGNDNSEDNPTLNKIGKYSYKNISTFLPFIKGNYDSGPIYCRKDKNYWTLFSTGNFGIRFTFSFDDLAKDFRKYDSPLLCDVKITDYCTTGCSFCYQGSTKKGKHASFDTIKKCFDALAKLNVFEVAIGGGNPVSHPNFMEILSYASSVGIIPNFSTRDLSFTRSKEKLDFIYKNCGNFAFSVNPNQDYDELKAYLDKCNKIYPGAFDFKRLMNFQAFIGPGGFENPEDLKKLFLFARENFRTVTLLGYKQKGRASETLDTKGSYWILDVIKDVMDKHKCPNIGIDTCLAEDLDYSLRDSGIPEALYSTEEGESSCYIDLVRGAIARSSFEETAYVVDVTDPEVIRTKFLSF